MSACIKNSCTKTHSKLPEKSLKHEILLSLNFSSFLNKIHFILPELIQYFSRYELKCKNSFYFFARLCHSEWNFYCERVSKVFLCCTWPYFEYLQIRLIVHERFILNLNCKLIRAWHDLLVENWKQNRHALDRILNYMEEVCVIIEQNRSITFSKYKII